MHNKLVKFIMHGELGEKLGSEWNLNVSSVGEGLRAIDTQTHKLFKYFLEKDKENIKYKIVINGRPFYDEKLDNSKPETVLDTELVMNRGNLETVDVVPIIEGNDSNFLGIITMILGVVLIVASWGSATPLGIAAMSAGFGLVGAGVLSFLMKPPKFEDFREIETGGKTSYLFSGPQNVVGEGGPVPVGYGRLMVGSQVVTSAYVVMDSTNKKVEDMNDVEVKSLEIELSKRYNVAFDLDKDGKIDGVPWKDWLLKNTQVKVPAFNSSPDSFYFTSFETFEDLVEEAGLSVENL